MHELKEVKFLRTGKEYSLEKTETGFNCTLVDFDDVQPVHRSFSQLLHLSKDGQIVFTSFEEKKNEAELILLNCIHETEISNCKVEIENLTLENGPLKKENEELKEENETLKNIITRLKEAKEISEAQQ